MEGSFLFLGTGASTGTPVIGCRCPVCTSHMSHNRRLRPSGLIRMDKKTILIDCGPDFRQQALVHKINQIDALLLTHTHYDHIAGIDELRAFTYRDKKKIHCFLSQESFADVKKRYDYLFRPTSKDSTLKVEMEFHPLEEASGSFDFQGINIDYFSFSQCKMQVTGFRIGHFAYISDIHEYDNDIFLRLQGVKKLVISALDLMVTHAHLSVDEAVEFAHRAGAEQTWLTHISHHLDHDATERLLPPDIRMGYDGLEINIG